MSREISLINDYDGVPEGLRFEVPRLRRIHPAALPRPFSKGLHGYGMSHKER